MHVIVFIILKVLNLLHVRS